MSFDLLLPIEKNINRFRAELASFSEAELIAQVAKDPNMAPGIAAKQLLAALAVRRNAKLHKPHWTQVAGFSAAIVFGIVGIMAWLYPKQPAPDTGLTPTPSPQSLSQPAAASLPLLAPLAMPKSQPASAPPTAASQTK